jgi:PDZ domain-containing secreted protein
MSKIACYPQSNSLQKTKNFGILTTNPKRIEKLNLNDTLILITGENGKTFATEIGKVPDDALGNTMRIQRRYSGHSYRL